jgi:hypothetical protein
MRPGRVVSLGILKPFDKALACQERAKLYRGYPNIPERFK